MSSSKNEKCLRQKFRENQNTHFILTFCWPYILVYLSQYLTNLMHKICFTISFISCLYMYRAHVLIIRRSKLHYTASGIITPTGGRLVRYSCHKLVTFGLKTSSKPARAIYPIPWDTRNWVAQYEQLHTKGWRRKWLVITSDTCVICHLWTQRREHRHVVLAPLCPTGRVLPPASSSAI